MGAMIIGMITGGIAMAWFIAITFLYVVIVFIDAYRHKMKAVLWAAIALLFNFWSLPVYVYVRIKIATLKCPSCGGKVSNDKNFCSCCGTEIKKVDDGAIAKKFLKYVLIGWAVFSVIGVAYTALTSIWNP